MDNCFPRENRIKTWPEFKQVLRKGRRYRHPFFMCYYRPNTLNIGRLGVIISKRNVRLATHRNQVRRLLRETYRTSTAKQKGMDAVIVIQHGVNKADKRQLKQCLEECIERLAR